MITCKTQSTSRRTAATFLVALGLFALACLCPAWGEDKKKGVLERLRDRDRDREHKFGDCRLSGPYHYHNLTVYLVLGEDRVKAGVALTLHEALAQKKIHIYETETVHQLAVENICPDAEIFIQSGDIVKGGKQDRTIGIDILLPPQSGRILVPSMCVEEERWGQRGQEPAGSFSLSTERLPSRELRLALAAAAGRHSKEIQKQVWSHIGDLQKQLGGALKVEVRARESGTSLQLTLENARVKASIEKYQQHFQRLVEEKKDAIGYVFAINGKIVGAEVYGSHALFKKLWPGLLKANAVEAVADVQLLHKPVTADSVIAFLTRAEKGKEGEKGGVGRVSVQVRGTDTTVFVEARDGDRKGVWIHRSYLAR